VTVQCCLLPPHLGAWQKGMSHPGLSPSGVNMLRPTAWQHTRRDRGNVQTLYWQYPVDNV
jgi:hypothetical protein